MLSLGFAGIISVACRISGRTFEFPVERSKLKKTGHPKISVVVGISGRTFEFPVERSKSGKTFKFRKTGHPKIEVTPPKII